MAVESDVGIPDLIHRLSDDSKRLIADEIRLAKLELKDDMRRGGHGATWLAVAFGTGVVAMTCFTVFLTTLIGRMASGQMWVGAFVTGVIELGVGGVLIKRGIAVVKRPSYSLEQTREALKDTATWVAPELGLPHDRHAARRSLRPDD
jgi:hypothetical protein